MKLKPLRTDMTNLAHPAEQQISVETSIVQERVRQARNSFNLALTAIGVSACVCVAAAGLKLPEGNVMAAGSLASSACCIRFAKDANDRLDKVSEELSDQVSDEDTLAR